MKNLTYKNFTKSRIPWLDSFPSHWSVETLNRKVFVQGGYAFSSDDLTDLGVNVIRIGDIKIDGSVDVISCKKYPNEITNKLSQFMVFKGELLMAMTGATIGKAGWYEHYEPSLLNQRVGVFRIKNENLLYRFLWYVLQSKGYQEYVKLVSFGGAQPNISNDAMLLYQQAIPPVKEQETIINYLDINTSRIDNLITEKQHFIDLLKEKRQALISHYVTKGLDPTVPMKDSGVEWIGEIPESWVTSKLKYHTIAIIDTEHKTIPFVDESEYFVVRTSNVKDGRLLLEECRRTDKFSFEEWTRRGIPLKGDMILTREAPVGEACVLTSNESVCLGQRTVLIRFSKSLLADYFLLVVYSDLMKDFIESVSIGSTVKHLNMSDIPNIPFYCPDIDEQQEIVNEASEQLSVLREIESETYNSITLLKEHRTALISAAVTGKIDVRDLAAFPTATP